MSFDQLIEVPVLMLVRAATSAWEYSSASEFGLNQRARRDGPIRLEAVGHVASVNLSASLPSASVSQQTGSSGVDVVNA